MEERRKKIPSRSRVQYPCKTCHAGALPEGEPSLPLLEAVVPGFEPGAVVARMEAPNPRQNRCMSRSGTGCGCGTDPTCRSARQRGLQWMDGSVRGSDAGGSAALDGATADMDE